MHIPCCFIDPIKMALEISQKHEWPRASPRGQVQVHWNSCFLKLRGGLLIKPWERIEEVTSCLLSLAMNSSPLNLYGIPFRSWLLLNQNISWIRQAEMSANQFSSQEKNQGILRQEKSDLFYDIHKNFHIYFVTIITILSAVISAFIFIIIVWRTYSCCKLRKSNYFETAIIAGLPIEHKHQMTQAKQSVETDKKYISRTKSKELQPLSANLSAINSPQNCKNCCQCFSINMSNV